MLNVLQAFGQQPGADEVKKLAEGSPAAPLYERLGMSFACVDASGEYGGMKWDLNFDACPPEHQRRYDFVTNHGTTEHLLNQYNAFRIVHDLTVKGGLMMHALPFLSYVDHGYFCYQPNLFVDLARANGYELLGMWINIDPKMNHLIPWQHGLEKHLRSDTSDSLLLVLFRKTGENDFAMPFQTVYGGLVPAEVLQRYRYVVDGETVSGKRGLYLSMEDTLLRYYELKSSSSGAAGPVLPEEGVGLRWSTRSSARDAPPAEVPPPRRPECAFRSSSRPATGRTCSPDDSRRLLTKRDDVQVSSPTILLARDRGRHRAFAAIRAAVRTRAGCRWPTTGSSPGSTRAASS